MFVLWQLEGSVPLQIFRKSWKFVPTGRTRPALPGWVVNHQSTKKINVPLHSKLFWAFYFFFFVSLKFSQNVGFWGSYEISSPLLIVVCVSLHLWNPRPDYPTRSGDKSPLFKNIRNGRLPLITDRPSYAAQPQVRVHLSFSKETNSFNLKNNKKMALISNKRRALQIPFQYFESFYGQSWVI